VIDSTRLAEQLRADITRARRESEGCVIVHIPVLESLLDQIDRLIGENAALKEAARTLAILEAAGVDSWDGYEIAMEGEE
jgi:hypothetical protein